MSATMEFNAEECERALRTYEERTKQIAMALHDEKDERLAMMFAPGRNFAAHKINKFAVMDKKRTQAIADAIGWEPDPRGQGDI